MKFRNLDNNNDWNFGKGLQDYKDENEAILLNLKTRLYSFLGDCFFDRGAGIDWWNLLPLKNNQDTLGLEILRIINSSYGVTAINNFNLTIDENRKFNLELNIDTIFTENINQTLFNIGE